MGGGLLRTNNQQERKTKKLLGILGIGLVIGVVNVRAITSHEVTYENQGVTENLTETLDKLYRELKEYKTSGSVTSTEMLEGSTGYAKGKLVTGSIKKKGSTTYTPGVNNQVISKGQYLNEDQVILGDSNLKSENIKSGVEIFGINGSIPDYSGKTLEATIITSDEPYTYLNIPEGYYYLSSQIKLNTIKNEIKIGSSNVPEKVFHALVVITSATSYQNDNITVQGSIIESKEFLKSTTLQATNYYNVYTNGYDLKLSGKSGTINISFSGGAVNNQNAYVIYFYEYYVIKFKKNSRNNIVK